MELTEELKKQIDAMTYEDMLRRWRFSPAGDPIFTGDSSVYYEQRMKQLKDEGADHVAASNNIGWEPK